MDFIHISYYPIKTAKVGIAAKRIPTTTRYTRQSKTETTSEETECRTTFHTEAKKAPKCGSSQNSATTERSCGLMSSGSSGDEKSFSQSERYASLKSGNQQLH
eukprot:7986064-Pyramimonas_sp.AAC.1